MTTSAPSYSNAEYTGESEWFTPAGWIERARRALGEIDLDPASHAIAQRTVRAQTFFTAADNGLDRPWFVRVWLNPPYNRALLAPFVDKLVSEYSSGQVQQAILLTHNYTDTEWFHTAARVARALPSARPNPLHRAFRRGMLADARPGVFLFRLRGRCIPAGVHRRWLHREAALKTTT